MKNLLLLAIFFAVSNAAIILQFYPGNKYSNELRITQVFAASPAIGGQNKTIKACSVAKSEVSPLSFTYEVVGPMKNGEVQKYESGTKYWVAGNVVSTGSNFCFSLTVKAPEDVERQFYVKFDIFNAEEEGITNFIVVFPVQS